MMWELLVDFINLLKGGFKQQMQYFVL